MRWAAKAPVPSPCWIALREGRARLIMSEPKISVSVVVPVYNRRDLLVDAIESALKQSFPPEEIIVVDDGSEDGVETIDFPAIDPRIRLIRHERNLGGSAARNTGIDAAIGDWVALLDCDDQWLPGKLERQIAEIQGSNSSDRFFVCSNTFVAHGDGAVLSHNKRPPERDENIAEYLMVENAALQTSTLLIPTSIAREVRFRDGLRRHQDWDFVLRLIATGVDWRYIDEPLSVYYLGPDQRRVSLREGAVSDTLAWFKQAKDLLTPRAMQTYFVHSALGRRSLETPLRTAGALLWVAGASWDGAIRVPALMIAKLLRRS